MKNYVVLARKYRPQIFDDLIGQEVLVRTLTNGIKNGKLAQSYILTGIRGIGKTTSARIIAKALNCVGADGNGTETPNPCGVCEHCKAIAEDRHVDVQEIDAASNTGVDNIREIIDGTRYNPASARYKIYIIDEVHMLSKNAFNALLKTLEEPPAKVKFIFATTEIRKVPVTVLSRCQRFDLRRIDEELLGTHFTNIAKKEQIEIEEDAVKIIARLADGSVRDGLSLLDQSIAQSEGVVTTAAVREMVGISSKETLINLYESLLKGDIGTVLNDFKAMYNQGYDPVTVIQDLLNLTHLFTKLKLKSDTIENADLSDSERNKVSEIANQIEMPVFTMFWQMLLKGIDEIRISPSALQTVEMLLVRMCYMQGNTPTVDMLDKVVLAQPNTTATSPVQPAEKKTPESVAKAQTAPEVDAKTPTSVPTHTPVQAPTPAKTMFKTLSDVIDYAVEKSEMSIAVSLRNDVRVVKFEEGLIEITPTPQMEDNFAYKLSKKLLDWTNKRWLVNTVENTSGAKTVKEIEQDKREELKQDISKTPIVSAVLNSFPQSKIIDITKLEQEQQEEEDITDGYDGNDETSSGIAEEA